MSGGRFERKEGECGSAWEHMHTQARRHTNTEGFTNSRTHSTSTPAVQRGADIAIHAGNHRGSRQLQRHLLNVLKHSMCPPHTHTHAHTRTHTQTHAHAHTHTHAHTNTRTRTHTHTHERAQLVTSNNIFDPSIKHHTPAAAQ
jgi:hypothetical protein